MRPENRRLIPRNVATFNLMARVVDHARGVGRAGPDDPAGPAPRRTDARGGTLLRRGVLVVAVGAALLAMPSGGVRADAGPMEVYVATVDAPALEALVRDGRDLGMARPVAEGRWEVEIVLTGREAADLATDNDLKLRLWRGPDGLTVSEEARLKQEQGYQVFRSFDEAGGIRDELNQLATDHPDLVKWEVVGTSVQDRPIVALKVTKDAATEEDGSRPAVLFSSLQHAREWIGVEVNRRLLHYLVDGYGQDDTITQLLDGTEVWFVVVANPDGYEYSFGEERLWRKNLRDLDGDGQIVGREGVDLNRNFDTHWGYDNDGSSDEALSDTYRGPSPASEPETQAMQGLLNRVPFVFQVNYHAAASAILYGTGWQDITWAPDDPIQAALAGDRFRPAVEGFVPMLSSAFYITNGETCDYAHEVAGTLCWTPELTPGGIQGRSGFEFPDDEAAIQQEFEKNLPFAMDVALSATQPEAPASHLGNTAVALSADPFAVSYGSPQLVSADAQRTLGEVTLHYRINGGNEVTAAAVEWEGGERYGAAGDALYRRVRGEVAGAGPGDDVEVWFTAAGESTAPFTYQRVPTSGAKILVVAAEDYTGAAPDYGPGSGPRYLSTYLDALSALGYPADVYDVDARGRGAPHPLGVLSHYDLVIWYTGDDVVPQAPGMADGTVSRLARDMMMATRDFMNEGGKLIHAGRWAGSPYFRGLEYDPVADAPCDPSTGADGCVRLQNDFYQYYLGVDGYGDDGGTSSSGGLHPVHGLAGPFEGADLSFAPPPPGVTEHSALLAVTSDRMPAAEFPQFASQRAAIYDRPGDKPRTGDHVVYSGETGWTYQRLMRTVDLTSETAATLEFWLSYDVRDPWDAIFVEVHTVGEEDWTTLPDANGHTSPEQGASHCRSRNFSDYPQLAHYMTADQQGNRTVCLPQGTTGEWHPANGTSGGEWQQWSVDLSAYAGREIEVSISYLSSRVPYFGVLIDDVALSTGDSTSFEDDLGGWVVAGPPGDAEAPEVDFKRLGGADIPPPAGAAIVLGADSVTFGFSLTSLGSSAQVEEALGRALDYLGIAPPEPPRPRIYLPALRTGRP